MFFGGIFSKVFRGGRDSVVKGGRRRLRRRPKRHQSADGRVNWSLRLNQSRRLVDCKYGRSIGRPQNFFQEPRSSLLLKREFRTDAA